MKTLVLVRHAKSSWVDSDLADFDRPLKKRGKKNAPDMANRLKNILSDIDGIISSDAKRAYDTARIFSKSFGGVKIKTDEDLYLASSKKIIKVVRKVKDKHDTVCLFAHNPGITMAVNQLSKASIMNVPTCGMAVIRFDIDSWKDLAEPGELIHYDFPKNK